MNDSQHLSPRDAFAEAERRGLYRSAFERDACGVGFVASTRGERSHTLVELGLEALRRMAHRGATGADAKTGDGAGLLIHVPHALLAGWAEERGVPLPEPGAYGLGMVFLPRGQGTEEASRSVIRDAVCRQGLSLLGFRKVPHAAYVCGVEARATLPAIEQFVVAAPPHLRGEALERQLYLARRDIEQLADAAGLHAYVCSLSHRIVVYKGLLLAEQLADFYRDLRDPRTMSGVAVFHQRFSTNTLPRWERAQPMRLLAHNGEINTLRGNLNSLLAREATLGHPELGPPAALRPVVRPGGSDSAALDNTLELIVRAGQSLPGAVAMALPPAWENDPHLHPDVRAFFAYNAGVMEPWDGPAALAFCDGEVVGAALDRNGLRPARWTHTADGLLVVASETGVVDLDARRVIDRGQLEPGGQIVLHLATGAIRHTEALRMELARSVPAAEWLQRGLRVLHPEALTGPGPESRPAPERLFEQRLFGYSQEDLRVLLGPMAETGAEPVGSMGNDTPPAVLSERPQRLFEYFKQLFAQVTNPPIDPLREAVVMSMRTTLGPRHNLLEAGPAHCVRLELSGPMLDRATLAALLSAPHPELPVQVLKCHYDPLLGAPGLESALLALVSEAEHAVAAGARVLVLSDREVPQAACPLPSLLALGAVSNGLLRAGRLGDVSLVIDSGEPREVMHVALLVGYGAAAVHPRLAIESVRDLAARGDIEVTADVAERKLLTALSSGLKKVMSKMGISTIDGYRGAQVFEAVGLDPRFVDQWLTGTVSRLGGIGLPEIHAELRAHFDQAQQTLTDTDAELDEGGVYQWRRRGEKHRYDPNSIAYLQHAVRKDSPELYQRYTEYVSEADREHGNLRGLLRFRPARAAISPDAVEPASEIVKRFKTGAMSFGSISREAHETLAIAMNRLGGKSNTGEGGEDPSRAVRDANGDSRRSAIKQVASGRFGVTMEYLVSADELQIKMAQGAKPGEGGQLPGHKVDETIARLRYSTPGVGLISPPPHHDIYSIEDLAQLIFDLKHANPQARISVKLVSEVGVGTVAAGVAKAGADLVLISGCTGGTGASPLSSIRHAGLPWELGLAEAHQSLVLNGLRGRVRVETDGQLRTGRDVAIAAALGAEEFGFATAALVAMGCILMRACHLNTCPVGVATQDPVLRERFSGKPEHVTRMMLFIAEEVRTILASLGLRSLADLVGRTDLLETCPTAHVKARHVDLSPLLYQPAVPGPRRHTEGQPPPAQPPFDASLLPQCAPALESKVPVLIKASVTNTDRAVGTLLSSEVVKRHGAAGLPAQTIRLELSGAAGQSLGAFAARGVCIHLIGEANDYVGKGLSGGQITVVPEVLPEAGQPAPMLVGNVALYGATEGECFIYGRAGARFAVRNSGATAVVEGVGDHCCEYMTRGTVVVLGSVGRNFAAGMSGGVAYVYDPEGILTAKINADMVDVEPLGDHSELLRRTLQRYLQRTKSWLAGKILSNFAIEHQHFRVVMPREYKNALALAPTQRAVLQRIA
jgi:glutamate synthase domain-containing protein 2/glutamate synthase domain-containing protein 1/glutamate synthase domain-containing protein 3